MARHLTLPLSTIRDGLMAGAVALIRAGDAVTITTRRVQRVMRELVDEARRRARAHHAGGAEPRRVGGGEAPETVVGEGAPPGDAAHSTGGDVPVRVPEQQSVSPTQPSGKRGELEPRSVKRRGATRARTPKRRPPK